MSNNHTNNGGTQNGQYRGNYLADVAWLAGVFDGEGSVVSQVMYSKKGNRTESPCVKLRISNTSMKLMEKFQKVVQAITFKKFAIRDHSYVGGKRCFSLDIGDQVSVRKVCAAMLPHLTVKQAQAELAINFCESRKMNRHKGFGFTEWERGIVAEMHRLKTIEFVYQPPDGVVTTERVAPYQEIRSA